MSKFPKASRFPHHTTSPLKEYTSSSRFFNTGPVPNTPHPKGTPRRRRPHSDENSQNTRPVPAPTAEAKAIADQSETNGPLTANELESQSVNGWTDVATSCLGEGGKSEAGGFVESASPAHGCTGVCRVCELKCGTKFLTELIGLFLTEISVLRQKMELYEQHSFGSGA